MNNSGQPFLKFELQIGFDKEHLNFTHTYRIKNRGPSPTQKSTEIIVLIPKSDLVKFVNINPTPGANCNPGPML